MTGFYEDLGANVRKAREAAGLVQDDIARALEVTRATVSNIERGKHRLHAHHLVTIAALLGVNPGDLFPSARPPTEESEAVLAELREKLADMDPVKREELERKLGLGDRPKVVYDVGEDGQPTGPPRIEGGPPGGKCDKPI